MNGRLAGSFEVAVVLPIDSAEPGEAWLDHAVEPEVVPVLHMIFIPISHG